MHPYKRTIAALLVAGALVSQAPVIAHADDNASCYMSRNMNGERWSSSDCNDMPKMQRDMQSLNAMLAQLFQPVESEKPASQNQDQKANADSGQNQDQGQGQGQNGSQNQNAGGNPSPASAKKSDPLSSQTMDAIAAFIRNLFDRLWFWS